MQEPLLAGQEMPPPRHGIHFSLARPIRASRTAAFRWWTDFDAGDPLLSDAGRLVSREVIRREGNVVWKRDVNRALGLTIPVVSRIDLDPRGFAWDLASESPLHGVRGHYRLTPEGRGRCRLTAAWHVFARRAWVRPVLAATESHHRARLAREWDGYISALEGGR